MFQQKLSKKYKIQKKVIWNGNNPQIKNTTLCNKYENGGLKKDT